MTNPFPLRDGRRVVQCHGCFDLLHIGHIRHFEAAKRSGDLLVVTVTPDRFVNKGPRRPVFSESLRMEAVAALKCVDAVQLTDSPTAADAIREIRPDVFAKGPDYSESTLEPCEKAALDSVGGRLLITQTAKWSSTALLHGAMVPPNAESYLETIRAKYPLSVVKTWLEQARKLKVLVIGDAILDEYRYCNTLGKSGKEPILAAQFVRAEQFAGGVEAVAKHVSAVCDAVMVCTGPVTVKRRFIETYPFQKLFEEYEMDEAAAAAQASDILQTIDGPLDAADLVIVADYGHGLLTRELVGRISQRANYLAVNVQANAGNHGFNTISKYPCADFISLSERELRLDARDQASSVRDLMLNAAQARQARLLVTRGAHGCLAYQPIVGFSDAPAFATHTVDRVGAGDAVFGVTACCAAIGMPLDLLTFLAAAVGTQAVGIVGNARCIERESLLTHLEGLLA